MANKRDLKQVINEVSEQLFAECMAASISSEAVDQDTVKALLSSIVMLRNDYVARISHPEPGMAAKQYFDTLEQEFWKHAHELMDQINGLA